MMLSIHMMLLHILFHFFHFPVCQKLYVKGMDIYENRQLSVASDICII